MLHAATSSPSTSPPDPPIPFLIHFLYPTFPTPLPFCTFPSTGQYWLGVQLLLIIPATIAALQQLPQMSCNVCRPPTTDALQPSLLQPSLFHLPTCNHPLQPSFLLFDQISSWMKSWGDLCAGCTYFIHKM
jgi:hypothetical protein